MSIELIFNRRDYIDLLEDYLYSDNQNNDELKHNLLWFQSYPALGLENDELEMIAEVIVGKRTVENVLYNLVG